MNKIDETLEKMSNLEFDSVMEETYEAFKVLDFRQKIIRFVR
jgi:hypothetical protein